MKLKTFGLIEAIIGSAIMIVFAVAMAFVSIKANQVLAEAQHEQVAQKIVSDYLARLILLESSGHITFDSSKQDNQIIPIDCFSTDVGEGCKNSILDAYPQNQFPFFNMISDQSIGNYKLLKKDYLSQDEASEDFYKIKVQVNKTDCAMSESVEISNNKCRNINLQVIWQEPVGIKKYELEQYIADLYE